MKSTEPIDLSVVIPVIGRSENLVELLPMVHESLNTLGITYEILVVDQRLDGASDSAVQNRHSRLIKPDASGYGNAIRTGLTCARGNYILTMDADLSHPAPFLPNLWRARGSADVLIASRYYPGGKANMSVARRFFSRILNLVFTKGLGLEIHDMSSGFRLYRNHVVKGPQLRSDDLDILQELLVFAYTQGFRIREIPFTHQQHGQVRPAADFFRFGRAYFNTFIRLWKLRNSISSADYDARAYDTWLPPQRYWQRKRYLHITELMNQKTACLDLGCGSSRIIEALPKGSVAVDILFRKLRFSKRYGQTLVNASALSLPFPDESFECVICSQLIEHIPRDCIFDELHRVLRKGGRLVLGTPDYANWQWLVIEWLYARLLPQAYADEHITHYTRSELLNEFVGKRSYKLEEERYILRGELILALCKG